MVVETTMIIISIMIISIPTAGWIHLRKSKKFLELEYNIKIARALGKAALLRDHETEAHNLRVAYMSAFIGEMMQLKKIQLQGLMKGAFLHDIGKIGIPDSILLKSGKLDNTEWQTMEQHPLLGKELVDQMPWFEDAIDVILYHHEKFDGSGYPFGLKGENIPLHARIFSIIDVFDALVSKRPYKEPLDIDTALNIIKSEKGSHFDPNIVDIFCDNIAGIYTQVYTCSEDKLQSTLMRKRKKVFGL